MDVLQPLKEESAQEPIQHALIEDEKRVDLYGNVVEDIPVKGRRQRKSSTGIPKERKTQEQLDESEPSDDKRKKQKRKITPSRKKAETDIEQTDEHGSEPTQPVIEG